LIELISTVKVVLDIYQKAKLKEKMVKVKEEDANVVMDWLEINQRSWD